MHVNIIVFICFSFGCSRLDIKTSTIGYEDAQTLLKELKDTVNLKVTIESSTELTDEQRDGGLLKDAFGSGHPTFELEWIRDKVN